MFLLIIYAQNYAQNSKFLVKNGIICCSDSYEGNNSQSLTFILISQTKSISSRLCFGSFCYQSVYVLKSYYYRRIYWTKELTNAALKVTLNGYFKSITQKAFTAKIQMMDVNASLCRWMTNCVVSLLLQWEIISGSVNFCAAASLLLYNIIIIIIIVIAIISHTIAFSTQLY